MSFGCRKRWARDVSDAIDHSLHEQPSGISSSVDAGHDGSLVAPAMECFGIPTVDSDTDIVSDVSSSDFSDLACHNEVDVADNSVGEEQQLLQALQRKGPYQPLSRRPQRLQGSKVWPMNWFHVLYISASKIWSNRGSKGQYPLRSASSSYIENEMKFVLFQGAANKDRGLVNDANSSTVKLQLQDVDYMARMVAKSKINGSVHRIKQVHRIQQVLWGAGVHISFVKSLQRLAVLPAYEKLAVVGFRCQGTWQFFDSISSTVWINWKHLRLSPNIAMRLVCHHTVLKCVTPLLRNYPLIELSISL